MKNLSDKEICIRLRSGDDGEQDSVLNYIYSENFPIILSFIRKNSGSEDDALDVFQDAIVVFYEKVRMAEFELTSSIKTYLYSICRNIWFNKLKSQNKIVQVDDEFDSASLDPASFEILEVSERNALLLKVLESIGTDCKKLLMLYYYDRLRMNEIATKMKFASADVAKSKKSVCMKKLKALIAKVPSLKELLSKY